MKEPDVNVLNVVFIRHGNMFHALMVFTFKACNVYNVDVEDACIEVDIHA